MKILFGKSKWEMDDSPLETFLQRAKNDGFEVVEIYLESLGLTPGEIRQRVADSGLQLVAQLVSEGRSPDEHIASIDKRFAFAAETRPLMVNTHLGKDHFSFDDNLRILGHAIKLADEAGMLLTQETHRGRPLFAAHETRRYLEALPKLNLNADFSHWFNVHESDLSDQPENVEVAIQRARYIHARVGFEEGPQIPDPLAPAWQSTVSKFIDLWNRIIAARVADGTEFLVVTPEFGPPPYMPCEPYTNRPMADAWSVNAAFLPILKEKLKAHS